MDLPKMVMQTQREGPFRSFPGIPVSRGHTHCSGLRFLGQTCASRFRGPAQPPWPRAQRQEQVLPGRRGPQGEAGAAVGVEGRVEGEGGYEVPKRDRVGTTWKPQRTPPDHEHSTTTQQLQTPALQRSKPEAWGCF